MLRILLIDDTPKKVGRLRAALLESGFEVVDESGLTIDLPARVEALRPDVILIDTESPGRDVMEQVCLVSRDQPRPIVMFTDEHDPGVMRRAIQSGVSAYIVEGIQASRLQPILDVAMARFESDQALRAQLQAREAQLAERKRIELAKGLLMKMKHCGEEEAYTLMRRQAMSRQQKLIQVASRSSPCTTCSAAESGWAAGDHIASHPAGPRRRAARLCSCARNGPIRSGSYPLATLD